MRPDPGYIGRTNRGRVFRSAGSRADTLCMPTKTASPRTRTKPGAIKPVSRAVQRDIEAGSSVDCAHCGERVKFQAKVRLKQVICNVYEKKRWVRIEHYHADCYVLAKEPYGPAEIGQELRRAAANAPAAATKSA